MHHIFKTSINGNRLTDNPIGIISVRIAPQSFRPKPQATAWLESGSRCNHDADLETPAAKRSSYKASLLLHARPIFGVCTQVLPTLHFENAHGQLLRRYTHLQDPCLLRCSRHLWAARVCIAALRGVWIVGRIDR